MSKAYEGDETRKPVLELEMLPVVPPKSNRVSAKVSFDAGRQVIQDGILIKFNQKTITLLTDEGRRRWKRYPQILVPVTGADNETYVIDPEKRKRDGGTVRQLLLGINGYAP